MVKKITSQIGTLLVVLLIAFFCFHDVHLTPRTESTSEIPDVPPVTETTPPPATAPVSTEPEETQPTEPLRLEIGPAPEGYFEDALFIGDSRTVGLQEYADFPGATFFASNGMSVYTVFNEKVNDTRLTSLLYQKQFGKIYIMLGINELIFDVEAATSQYAEVVKWLRSSQPNAIIFIQANLRVTAARSEYDRTFNNKRINAFNQAIYELTDGERVFYLDVNPLFDDGAGNLGAKYTADDIHVMGVYYQTWSEWIAENAAVPAKQ